MKNKLLIVLALVFSAYIGYTDLHQTDLPITVALLLAGGFVLGLFADRKLWLLGILGGLGIPVAEFFAAANHAILSGMEHGQVKYWAASYPSALVSLVSILFGLAGVYAGRAVKQAVSRRP